MGEDEKYQEQNVPDRFSRQQKENEYWEKRRDKRDRCASKGIREVWGRSPTHNELQRIYEEHDEAADRAEEEAKKAEKVENSRLKAAKKAKRKLNPDDSDSSSSSDHKKKRKHKKEKKSKKDKSDRSKKHKKRRKTSSSEVSADEVPIKKEKADDEWVELTKEIREKEAQKVREEESQIIGPQIPEALLASHAAESSSSYFDGKLDIKDRKNMLRGEAAAMAAYVAEGKRIPRRGEIGLSSDEIATFEQVGYIMSGTRHKSMEATRLRKENQILTAEEKRLLSGFTHEQRQQKEETVMKQFQSLISSKRGV